MASTMTLGELKTAVRQRADQENSLFIGEAELTSYINQSYFELYDLLVQKYGDNYFVAAPSTIATDGVNSQFSLPADFYKLLGVDLITGGNTITLKPFNFQERNQYTNVSASLGRTQSRYRLNGAKLWLTPTPSGGQTLTVWYIPKLTTLSADGDTMDGISGWTEYVIIDAAIKCMQKEESDVQVLAMQKMAIIKRIEEAAENRDAGQPSTVTDSYANTSSLGWVFGWDV